MRAVGLGLIALLGRAAATVDICLPSNSGSCCQGYTYNDVPLERRTTAPVCDNAVPAGPGVTRPTCGQHEPVCTKVETIPQGTGSGTLYCGNPIANTGSGTVTGSISITVGLCQSPTPGYCFIITATAPPGTTLDTVYRVLISSTKLTEDRPGQYPVEVAVGGTVYYPFSSVYTATCDSLGEKAVWIGFHTGEGGQTCWAGNSDLIIIPGTTGNGNGNNNWAVQLPFTYSCNEVCTSYCCCPSPPTIPGCTEPGYTESCPSQCKSTHFDGVDCHSKDVPNPSGWGSQPVYATVCCCKKPDDPPPCAEQPYTVQHLVGGQTTSCDFTGEYCKGPFKGSIASCQTGLFNKECCCCKPTPPTCLGTLTPGGACSGTIPTGYTHCDTVNDGCGNDSCCCTCTPDHSSCATLTPEPSTATCETYPPSGYTCEVKKDNCGRDFCCCTPKPVCTPDYSTSCGAPSTPKTGACTAADAGCTTMTDNCGNKFCCCAGTCSAETAFGVPNQCAAKTVCDKKLYPTVITLKDKGCGRWGWIIDTGTLTQPVSYRLWAGAGLNDLKKGSQVGSVSIQPCSAGSSSWCAVFSTTGSWVLTSAHVEADCNALSPRTEKNFPCAPGGYNDNGGNSCGTNGLPGHSWTSQPFATCTSNRYYLILHAAVSSSLGCTGTNCGNPDAGT